MEVFKSEGEFFTNVERALAEIDPKWRDYDGLIICGSHTPQSVEEKIAKIKHARETGRPYLGICFGYQLQAIEYARNVLGIEDATSEEFGKGTFVVKKRPQIKVGLHDGESYWNNFEVQIAVETPPYFFTTQFHPEYESRIDKPHPLLTNFLQYAKLAMQNESYSR